MKFISFFTLGFYLSMLNHSRIDQKEIIDLNNKLRQMPAININYGGCGFMALYLHEKLPGSEIINFYFGSRARVHFMVKYKGYYVDANGFVKYPVWNLLPSRTVSKQFLMKQVVKPNNWNSLFNRADTLIILNYLNK
jgi:hypothetical protein